MAAPPARDRIYGEHWVPVPFALLTDYRLSAQAVRVWAALQSHVRPNGRGVFPGRERLADLCWCSVDTVKRAIKDLEDAGWLKREQRPGAGGQFRTNEYTLCSPRGTDAPRSQGTDASRPAGHGRTAEVEEGERSRNVRPNGRNRAADFAVAVAGSVDDDIDDFVTAVDDDDIF